MMDIKELPNFVLMFVLVGILLGVGIVILTSFANSARISTTVNNESFTMPAVNKTVSLAQGNITTFTKIMNSSGSTLGSGNYTVDLDAGTINNTGNAVGFKNGTTTYAYYVYDDYTGTSTTSIRATSSALADISNTWLLLIIIVGVLGIILGLILKSFSGARA